MDLNDLRALFSPPGDPSLVGDDRDRDPGEAVTCADGFDAHPLPDRSADGALDGRCISGALDARRTNRLAPPPVLPRRPGRCHRKALPSPR